MAQALSPQQQQQANMQQNLLARQICINNCIDATQQIASTTYTNGQGYVINVPLKNVGIVKRYWIKVSATISGSAGQTHTLTKLGMANFFSSVVLTDLSNQVRISTTGWHLMAVASAKARLPYGSAVTATDTPLGYGNNFTKTMSAPVTITATAAADNVFAIFEVPLAYNDDDLRGAIFANVVNATYNLQLTVNPAMLVATGVDATLAVYQSGSATVATLSSYTITIYQNYLDQVPTTRNGPILPLMDLATAYLLNNTAAAALVANQDFPLQYANFRDFLSTTLIYNNAGVLNPGTDINYFALQAANYTNIWKYGPEIASLNSRLRMQSDFPIGMYYFDHRRKPISTVQYGNMQLVVNPITVTSAASQLLIGYESLAIINQVTQAGSLFGN